MRDPVKKTLVKVKKTTVADRGDYDDLRANAKTGGGGSAKLATAGTPPRQDYDDLRTSAIRGSSVGGEKTIARATPEEYKKARIMVKKTNK